jgi:fatty-acid desaturase
MTVGKPGFSVNRKSIWEGFMEKAIVFINEPTTKERIQHYLLDPLLNHVMERVFPYIILTCVLFTLLLIVAMLTFAMVFIQMRQPIPGSASSFIAPFPTNL